MYHCDECYIMGCENIPKGFFPITRPCEGPSGSRADDATTALPTGSSVNDGGVGCSSMSRADRQWNNWDGGATASMGKCKSAGSLNNRGPPHDPRRKTLTRTYEFTLTTTLTQAIRRAPRYQTERRETRQIAARPALRTGCAETRQQRDQGGKNREAK